MILRIILQLGEERDEVTREGGFVGENRVYQDHEINWVMNMSYFEEDLGGETNKDRLNFQGIRGRIGLRIRKL